MKRLMCALLAMLLLAAISVGALAENGISEIVMVYEDYDGNRAEQTISDDATLKELEEMLLRAAKSPAKLDGCTMNSTLFCMMDDGTIYDFAIATDGCPFITSMDTNNTYRMTDEDQARFWEIFDLIQEAMGFDASMVLVW